MGKTKSIVILNTITGIVIFKKCSPTHRPLSKNSQQPENMLIIHHIEEIFGHR